MTTPEKIITVKCGSTAATSPHSWPQDKSQRLREFTSSLPSRDTSAERKVRRPVRPGLNPRRDGESLEGRHNAHMMGTMLGGLATLTRVCIPRTPSIPHPSQLVTCQNFVDTPALCSRICMLNQKQLNAVCEPLHWMLVRMQF